MSENTIHKTPPIDWSKYERTYNNAIDLCAQAIGFYRAKRIPIKAIILKPTSYELFKRGVELLQKKRIDDPLTELYFDGVEIRLGNSTQIDTAKFEFYPTAGAQLAKKQLMN